MPKWLLLTSFRSLLMATLPVTLGKMAAPLPLSSSYPLSTPAILFIFALSAYILCIWSLSIFLHHLECRPPVRARISICLHHFCFPSTWDKAGTRMQSVLWILLDEWGGFAGVSGKENRHQPALSSCTPEPSGHFVNVIDVNFRMEGGWKKGKKPRPWRYKP